MARLTRTILRLSRRPEARHVGILTSGGMAAQLVLLASSPLLARLFAPAAFGIFSLMLTIATIGGAIGGLCYEVAIILPRSRRMAKALYQLAFTLSLVTPLVTVGALALVQALAPNLLGQTLPAHFYLYCLVATALTTQINILGYAHSRATQYRAISIGKFSQTLLPALAQIALALVGMGGEGLLLGRVLGLAGTQIWLWRGLPRGFGASDLIKVRARGMQIAARSYRDFLVQVPRQLLVRGATVLPMALILGAYGPTAAGLYFFAARLVERPGMLLGDALSRVPMKHFADHVQACKPLVRPALLYSAAVGAPVVLGVGFLALIAHPFFRIAFGMRWEGAADYAVILAAWAAVRLASLPIATLTTVLRVQRLSFYVDALFAGRVVVIPLMAALQMGPRAAVAAFCALSITYHLVIVSVGLSAALRYDRGLQAPARPNTLDIAQPGESYG